MATVRAVFRCVRSAQILKSPTHISSRLLTAAYSTSEVVTHTGQKFDDGDWKKTRFIDGVKLVNTNVAADMIDEIAPIETSQRVISCDGGGGALGHPKVFINVDKPGAHACGYCGLRFVKKSHH